MAFYPASKLDLSKPMANLGKDLHADNFNCSNLLESGEYQLLSVDAPNVPKQELKTAIRWKLKDMLDYHIDDATFDVLDIPVDKEAGSRNHSMFAVAARNQLIRDRQALFEEAKLPLSVIDIPEMAQRNIAALAEPPGRGIGLLSFDASGGLLTVTFGGELYLSRRLDVSLPQLSTADDAQREALYERITLELQRSFDHFDRQYRHIALAKLLLFPMGASGTALQTHLAANLYFPVEMLSLTEVVDISRVPELTRLESQQKYFLTLGAALRQEAVAL
ncbi:MAG: type IV pilus biogenesis protein PilM [Burkholderiaceae bacterium]